MLKNNAGSPISKRDGESTAMKTKEEKKVVKRNDIREIRSIRQLENVNLDLDSPRMKQAFENLGVSETELMKK